MAFTALKAPARSWQLKCYYA